MQTVVETAYFIATSTRCLTDQEHAAAIELLATHPEKGDVLAVYTKNTKDDLSPDEKKQLAALARTLTGG